MSKSAGGGPYMRVNANLTYDEFDEFKARAGQRGMSMSDFARAVISERFIEPGSVEIGGGEKARSFFLRLPEGMYDAAEERASQLGLSRSNYLRELLARDIFGA